MKWGPEQVSPTHWRFNLWAPGVEEVTLELSPPPVRHCEERSDEAIQPAFEAHWMASLRSQ